MSFFAPQNPGIGGLDELTLSEEAAVQTIAALGSAGYFLRTNLAGTGIEWVAGTGGGAAAFTDLSDAPSSFTGQSLKYVRVNAGETALEFATVTGGSFTVASAAEINTGTDNAKGVTPLGLNDSLYRRIYITATEPASPETNDLWMDESIDVPLYKETVLFSNNHTQYLNGVSASEILRTTLPTGQSFYITTVEATQRTGGTLDTDFSIVLYDVPGAAATATCNLNETEVVNAETDPAITLAIRVTNATGTDIDACYVVKGYIKNA